MATAKQKQHRLIVIETTVLVLVLTATVFYMKIRWNLNESELEMLTFPLVGAMTLLIVGLHFLQKPFLFHENNRFSRLVYQVKVIEEKNTINPQKVARLKDRLVDFAKRNPDFEKEVNRYLGDLTFATMDTEESLRYYTAALDQMEKGSDDYYYVFNRRTAGLLRLGDYQKALQEFKHLADIKPFYSCGLAVMYEFGWGVEPNLDESIRLFEQAARDGNDFAVINCSETRWRKTHPIPDPDDGYATFVFKWHNQEGYKAGLPALTASAEAGYAPSQYELGTLFMEGKLGKNKHVEAFHWLRMAADQDYPPALHNLGFLVQMRCMDPIKGDVNKPVIPQTLLFNNAVRLASYQAGCDLILKAAKAGFAPSQHSIGCTLLREGRRDEARDWLKDAANQGFKKAQEDYDRNFNTTQAS